MIIHPQLPATEILTVGSHTDIAPTITALIDMPEPGGWLGSTLLPPDPQRIAVINGPSRIYQNNGSLKAVNSPEDQSFIQYSNYLLGR
jgi:arylsulfatase A-like enzyme